MQRSPGFQRYSEYTLIWEATHIERAFPWSSRCLGLHLLRFGARVLHGAAQDSLDTAPEAQEEEDQEETGQGKDLGGLGPLTHPTLY